MLKRYLNNRGGAVGTVIIAAGLIIFILFPIFSVVFEKHLIHVKGQMLKDAIDITNIATYEAIKTQQGAKGDLHMRSSDIQNIFKNLLIKNLNLNGDMTPSDESIAEGQVTIQAIEIYTSGLPAVCPLGKIVNRAAVHSIINVPIKPSLYRGLILNAIGKQYIELEIHVDSEIPVNN